MALGIWVLLIQGILVETAFSARFIVKDIVDDEMTIQINNPERIKEAQEIIATQGKGHEFWRIVTGKIVKKKAPYNPRWSFHLDPDSIGFTFAAIEVCDAAIQGVEGHLDEVGGAFLPGCHWCPWSSQLVKQID